MLYLRNPHIGSLLFLAALGACAKDLPYDPSVNYGAYVAMQIEGVVSESGDGSPLANVQVVIFWDECLGEFVCDRDIHDGVRQGSATTDEAGRYELVGNYRCGALHVRAQLTGYLGLLKSFSSCRPGHHVLNLELSPLF